MGQQQKWIGFSLLIVMIFLLGGCGVTAEPITAESTGIWNHYFVFPLSWFIIFIAQLFDGNYGVSIIFVTIIIRLAILPLTLKQNKSSKAMQALKPEMEELRQKYDMKKPEEQQKMQQEMMSLYQKHGVNPLAGCLPIFIQMPILMAFYFAIMRTEEIAKHSFLWFDLGAPDPFYLLPIIAAGTTFLQSRMTMHTLPENMRIMLYIMPAMILFAGLAMPSALTLYWVIGNIFMIIQTYFLYGKQRQVEVNA